MVALEDRNPHTCIRRAIPGDTKRYSLSRAMKIINAYFGMSSGANQNNFFFVYQ